MTLNQRLVVTGHRYRLCHASAHTDGQDGETYEGKMASYHRVLATCEVDAYAAKVVRVNYWFE